MLKLDKERVIPIIKAALKEDIGKGDITTAALVGKTDSCQAVITVKEDCVVCGIEIAEWIMAQVDYSVRFKPNAKDGGFVGALKELVFLDGHTASILRAERAMINFMSLLSGIATLTKKFTDIVKAHNVKVMDTRKTIPLMRYLEKYAVSVGGGANHRMGLYDQVLIKDNHIKAVSRKLSAISLKDLVVDARKKNLKNTVVEIEVGSIKEFTDALEGKPDIIMLDNMGIPDVAACVEIRKLSKIKPLLEVSGNITLDNIERYARTGIDMISVGSLTDSPVSIDMSLDIV